MRKSVFRCSFMNVIILASLALLFPSFADASITYTMKKGDNPAKVAKKFGVRIDEVKISDGTDPRSIRPGTKVLIEKNSLKKGSAASHRHNAKSEAKTAKKSGGSETVASAGPLQAEGQYHKVRKGDTLASVSRKYSISVHDLKELNGLRSSRLNAGQRLLVKRTGPRTYTVRKGDNVWRVARRFGMDPDYLVELNELDSDDLKPGQKLYLEEKVDNEKIAELKEAAAKLDEELKKAAEEGKESGEAPQSRLVTFSKKLLNIPYKFGGSSIMGIDCSAYVRKVYGLLGVELPRTAREQFHEGEAIAKDDLSIGDLIFFRTYASFPSHVGIYLGNNLFIHASSRSRKVTIDNLDAPYYVKRFIGAKRLLSESEKEDN